MNKKLLLSLALAGFMSVNNAWAQESELDVSPPSASEEIVERATVVSVEQAEKAPNYNDWVAEFENDFGQSIGVAKSGTVFYSGMAAVNGQPIDPNFGKQLAIAYERAMFDLRANFVMQNYGRLMAETVSTIYQNDSTNKDDFDPVELEQAGQSGGSTLNRLLTKAVDLIDKKLDSALIEQGVPAEDVQSMSVEQQKTVYKNNLIKNTVKKAFHSMQGLVPVQTKIFTEETDNGTAVSVGVIAVRSEKTQQFASDIARKRASLVTGNPKSLGDILPDSEDGYLNEIGLRYTYDENGKPMLVSYGRTSLAVNPDWSPARVVRSRENANKTAQTLAETAIVEFVNTNIQIQESTEFGEINEEQLKRITTFNNGKQGEIDDTRKEISEIIDIQSSKGKATAQGDLRGTSVVKRWNAKDENGVLHVGTVVTWTYGQLDNANAIDKAAGAKNSSAGQNANQKAVATQTRTSRKVNDKSDF